MNALTLLKPLVKTDRVFFIVLAIIIALALVFYFVLIPLMNHKQYKEQRENLRKREASFKKNLANREEAKR